MPELTLTTASAPGRAIVAGEALVDLVTTAGGTTVGHLGGGPFNVARGLARLGRPTAFLGALSTDADGERLRDALAADGVDLRAAVATSSPTTTATAVVDADGHASYRFSPSPTSAEALTEAAALAGVAAVGEVAALHLGTLGLVLEPLGTALEAVTSSVGPRAVMMLDPNCRPSEIANRRAYLARLARVGARADVLKVSTDDLAWLDGERPPIEAARAQLDGAAVALVTRGGAGATVVTRDAAVDVPAPRVSVVDTIGAGDAFGAGFLAWWLERGLGRSELHDLDRIVAATAFACAVAARTCARAGADPPRRDEPTASLVP